MKMFPQINQQLLPIKGHYFLYNAATGPIVPFLPTIAKQLGFSSTLVGFIYMVLPISGLISKPLFGGLADKFRLHKTFFILFQALLTVSLFAVYFIPPLETSSVATVMTCDSGEAFIEIPSSKTFSSAIIETVANSNESDVSCELTCNGSTAAYPQLCSNWKAVKYCSYTNDTVSADTTFSFRTDITLTATEGSNRYLYGHFRHVTFSDDVELNPICTSLLTTNCTATCYNSALMTRVFNAASGRSGTSETSSYQFHLFLLFTIISWIGMAVVVSIADAICFSLLGENNGKKYGKQKMWGSIGFGIFGLSAGYLVDLFSQGQDEKDYTCIFYLMLVAMALDILVSFTLKKRETSAEPEPSVLWEMWEVGKEGRVLAFGWWCIGAGMCTGVIWNFLFWYTEEIATGDQSTWVKTLQGILTGVQCFAGELPFNFISGAVIHKLGHVNVMSLVLLVFAVRFMAYSLTTNIWLFILFEFLHGPSFGLCWPSMVSYGDKVAPPGTKATTQGLVGGVFEGIGVAAGSFLCGWLMDAYGGPITFRVFSAGALVWLAIHWQLQLLLLKTKANPVHQGHNHLASYAAPGDAIHMTMSQELQTY